MKKTPLLVAVGAIALIVFIGVAWSFMSNNNEDKAQAPVPTPIPEPVNTIPVSERPFVTLQPLVARNELEIVIHDLKKPADSVEVVLEYDRNKGVLDAVLRQFQLTDVPYRDKLFMGSKSAGGHITYHDDVVGGKLRLAFEGDEPYTLEVPWRYDDTQKQYDQFSTADGHFQIVFGKPVKQTKLLVMQSPGLPEELEGEVVAGPYLVRTVGALPDSTVSIKIRVPEEGQTYTLHGWDGAEYQSIDSTLEGKTLSAESAELHQLYVVTH